MYFVHSLARTQPNATHTYKHFCLCPHCIIHVTLHEELYQQKSGMLRRLEQGTHDSLSSCIIVRDLFALRKKKYLNYMSHNLGWASIISRSRIVEFMLRSQTDFIEFIPVYRDTDESFLSYSFLSLFVMARASSAWSHQLQHEIWEPGLEFWLLPKSQNVLEQIPAAKLIRARVDLSICVSDCMHLEEQAVFPRLFSLSLSIKFFLFFCCVIKNK